MGTMGSVCMVGCISKPISEMFIVEPNNRLFPQQKGFQQKPLQKAQNIYQAKKPLKNPFHQEWTLLFIIYLKVFFSLSTWGNIKKILCRTQQECFPFRQGSK